MGRISGTGTGFPTHYRAGEWFVNQVGRILGVWTGTPTHRGFGFSVSLGSGVGGVIDVAELLAGQVGVHLGRGNIGVAEHLLYRPQVTATGEQVGGEGVAQGVRAHSVFEASRFRMPLHDLL